MVSKLVFLPLNAKTQFQEITLFILLKHFLIFSAKKIDFHSFTNSFISYPSILLFIYFLSLQTLIHGFPIPANSYSFIFYPCKLLFIYFLSLQTLIHVFPIPANSYSFISYPCKLLSNFIGYAYCIMCLNIVLLCLQFMYVLGLLQRFYNLYFGIQTELYKLFLSARNLPLHA